MLLSNEFEYQAFNKTIHPATPLPQKFKLSRNLLSMLGDGFLVFDFLCLVAVLIFLTADSFAIGVGAPIWLGVPAAILASLIFYQRRLGASMRYESVAKLIWSHLLRFGLFTAAIVLIASLGSTLEKPAQGWLTTWLILSFLFTGMTRLLAFAVVRHLQQRGSLRETIALVGVGSEADRLVYGLSQVRTNVYELVGVFDDKIIGAAPGKLQTSGDLAKLIELGQSRNIDWILLTLPAMSTDRLQAILGRLMALSVPIGVCSQQLESSASNYPVNYVGDKVPVNLLSDRAVKPWETAFAGAENILPRWVVTSASLPIMLLTGLLSTRLVRNLAYGRSKTERTNLDPLSPRQTIQFDNYDINGFTSVASNFGLQHYGYVVTPNVDHMIRLHDESSFRALYAEARYILLDSCFVSHLLRLRRGLILPVCTGSDLTAVLFSTVILSSDRIVMIGGSDLQAQKVRQRYDLQHLAHYNPPMGFINKPEQVESCLTFIEANSPFRFCFLAVGAPQQEIVAQRLKERGSARGLALCIGASINFITGDEQRAPLWIRRLGMEWSFRLMQAPQRMAKRYLIKGPRIFSLLQHTDIVLRESDTMPTPVNPVRENAVYKYADNPLILESEQLQLEAVYTLLASLPALEVEGNNVEARRHKQSQVSASI